jgi:hypothetical protein
MEVSFMRSKSLEEAPYRRTTVSRPSKGRSCLNKADAKRRTQLEGLRACVPIPMPGTLKNFEQLSAGPADFY